MLEAGRSRERAPSVLPEEISSATAKTKRDMVRLRPKEVQFVGRSALTGQLLMRNIA